MESLRGGGLLGAGALAGTGVFDLLSSPATKGVDVDRDWGMGLCTGLGIVDFIAALVATGRISGVGV